MRLFKDMSGNYPDVIVTYFNFEKYVSHYEQVKAALFIGYNSQFREDFHEETSHDYKNKIFFNGEQPCAYTNPSMYIGNRSTDIANKFTDIYTICPCTADWANDLYNNGEEKFKPILFPIDKPHIATEWEKTYDAIFYGSICGQDHVDVVNTISKFKHKFLTLGVEHWYPNEPLKNVENLGNLITDINISTFEKWKILSQTKVVPIYNQLYIHDQHIKNIKRYDNWEANRAWSHIDEKRAPQLKPRVTEAALFKMLMLVKRDPWNLIEYWYEPGKDFIYFDSIEELEDLIAETTTNWEKYQPIVENAYKKAAANYTTEAILERMITQARKL